MILASMEPDFGSRARALLASPAALFLARAAVATPFIVSGVAKLLDFDAATAEVSGLAGLQPAAAFAALVILVQIGGSALLIAGGHWAWIGAIALAGFTIIATLLAHAYWTKPPGEQALHFNIFFEHVSIVGGLILAGMRSR